jgi:succinate-acetate transporter protein
MMSASLICISGISGVFIGMTAIYLSAKIIHWTAERLPKTDKNEV